MSTRRQLLYEGGVGDQEMCRAFHEDAFIIFLLALNNILSSTNKSTYYFYYYYCSIIISSDIEIEFMEEQHLQHKNKHGIHCGISSYKIGGA
jgi:hypothetical protein